MKLEDVMFTVANTLREAKIPSEVIVKVEQELEAAVKEEKEERAATPKDKSKNKFIVVALDPNGVLKASGGLTGWVTQVEDECPDQVIFDRINAAANNFNNSKKGRKLPVRSVGEAMEIPRRFWKTDKVSEKVLVKTKSPIYLLGTDGQLGK
jgi:hypothetical protein